MDSTRMPSFSLVRCLIQLGGKASEPTNTWGPWIVTTHHNRKGRIVNSHDEPPFTDLPGGKIQWDKFCRFCSPFFILSHPGLRMAAHGAFIGFACGFILPPGIGAAHSSRRCGGMGFSVYGGRFRTDGGVTDQ